MLGTWLDIRQEVTTRCPYRAFCALTAYSTPSRPTLTSLTLTLTFTSTSTTSPLPYLGDALPGPRLLRPHDLTPPYLHLHLHLRLTLTLSR